MAAITENGFRALMAWSPTGGVPKATFLSALDYFDSHIAKYVGNRSTEVTAQLATFSKDIQHRAGSGSSPTNLFKAAVASLIQGDYAVADDFIAEYTSLPIEFSPNKRRDPYLPPLVHYARGVTRLQVRDFRNAVGAFSQCLDCLKGMPTGTTNEVDSDGSTPDVICVEDACVARAFTLHLHALYEAHGNDLPDVRVPSSTLKFVDASAQDTAGKKAALVEAIRSLRADAPTSNVAKVIDGIVHYYLALLGDRIADGEVDDGPLKVAIEAFNVVLGEMHDKFLLVTAHLWSAKAFALIQDHDSADISRQMAQQHDASVLVPSLTSFAQLQMCAPLHRVRLAEESSGQHDWVACRFRQQHWCDVCREPIEFNVHHKPLKCRRCVIRVHRKCFSRCDHFQCAPRDAPQLHTAEKVLYNRRMFYVMNVSPHNICDIKDTNMDEHARELNLISARHVHKTDAKSAVQVTPSLEPHKHIIKVARATKPTNCSECGKLLTARAVYGCEACDVLMHLHCGTPFV